MAKKNNQNRKQGSKTTRKYFVSTLWASNTKRAKDIGNNSTNQAKDSPVATRKSNFRSCFSYCCCFSVLFILLFVHNVNTYIHALSYYLCECWWFFFFYTFASSLLEVVRFAIFLRIELSLFFPLTHIDRRIHIYSIL